MTSIYLLDEDRLFLREVESCLGNGSIAVRKAFTCYTATGPLAHADDGAVFVVGEWLAEGSALPVIHWLAGRHARFIVLSRLRSEIAELMYQRLGAFAVLDRGQPPSMVAQQIRTTLENAVGKEAN
ncbi:MAG: hypothetical protein SFV54_08335 [Bryobacteraceae bacterium]|nr:hypothetical protein [Bryobacteraceae bacterium]